jgi:hypothetical protein
MVALGDLAQVLTDGNGDVGVDERPDPRHRISP